MQKVRQTDNDILLKNKTKAEKVIFSIVFLLFCIYSFSLIYPLVWGFISSFKSIRDYSYNLFGLPIVWRFDNYVKAFAEISNDNISFLEMIWNSIWFSVGSAFLTTEITSFFAYVLNKYKFKGRNFLFGIALFLISVPIGPSFISYFRLMYDLKLTNSYLILLTATGGFGMNLLLLHSYFSNIAWAYAESAQMDGASFYQTYFKVMRPQAHVMCSTIFLLLFIGRWNDYMSPLLFMPEMLTLSTGLYKYRTIVEKSANYPVLFAGLIISFIPIMILYGLFCNKLMGNISLGGLKG